MALAAYKLLFQLAELGIDGSEMKDYQFGLIDAVMFAMSLENVRIFDQTDVSRKKEVLTALKQSFPLVDDNHKFFIEEFRMPRH
ncbi:unnamed protein product [Ambrosiozyma monospora]|uniref:Unnamed protein product n=1 Tax=Ambrosiozyma monospora TaxID=43982 RepID=A0ACB5T7V5_AMBMO|nr:unnamed protein product [Ambrosiozyma monospora]